MEYLYVYSVDELWKQYAEESRYKRPHILYDSNYMKCPEQESIYIGSSLMVAREARGKREWQGADNGCGVYF